MVRVGSAPLVWPCAGCKSSIATQCKPYACFVYNSDGECHWLGCANSLYLFRSVSGAYVQSQKRRVATQSSDWLQAEYASQHAQLGWFQWLFLRTPVKDCAQRGQVHVDFETYEKRDHSLHLR